MPDVIAVGNGVKSYSLDSLQTWGDMGMMPWATGSGPRSTTQMAASVAFLFRGVSLRAAALADVPWTIYKGDKALWESDQICPDGLQQFADIEDLLYRTEAALCLTSTAYWYKLRNRVRITGLQWLDPTVTTPYVSLRGEIVWYDHSAANGLQRLAIEDVVYIRNLGLGEVEPAPAPAAAAAQAAQALYNTNAFVRAFFERGAIKATLLTVEGAPSKEEREKLKSWWARMMSGVRNAFATEVISAAVKPIVIGEGIGELSNTALTREQREDIATALGVPHSLLMSNAANYATAEVDRLTFYDTTVIPACNAMARQLNRQLFAPLGLRFAWRPEAMNIYQEDEERRAGAVAAYVAAGMPLSIAVRLLGIDLPEGVEPEDLDQATSAKAGSATGDRASATSDHPILGYHIEQGVVSRNEARSTLGLPPVDESQDQRLRSLRTQLDLMIAAQSAGLPPQIAAQMVGLEVPKETFAQQPPEPIPNAQEGQVGAKTVEAAQLRRWLKKRPDRDVGDFDAHYLAPADVEAIAADVKGVAPAQPPFAGTRTREPYTDGADAERQALEEKHEQRLAAALTLWRKRAVGGAAVTPESFEDGLRENAGVVRDALYALLLDGALLGIEAGRYQVESAVYGRKATIVSTAWDIANQAVIAWLIGDGSSGLASWLTTLTNDIMATTIAQAAPLVAQWAGDGQPLSALVDALAGTGFSETRARRIALTEVTRAYAKGNREAWVASGVVDGRTWRTSADEAVCPICGPLAGQERALNEPFTPEISDPPAHVQCRCWTLPVVT